MPIRNTPSDRAKIITRRTYNRPLNEAGTKFETWDQTIDRVIDHQAWLWERAKGEDLAQEDWAELYELRKLMIDRVALVSGRTLWLGGTSVAKSREASQFNCSFGNVETVHDVVDAFWLLLQGCGKGFSPIRGVLNGFTKRTEVVTIRSTRSADDRGVEKNQEQFYTRDGKRYWHLTIGDSAEAWAKSVGKILAMKTPVDVVVLDYTQIRGGGKRLKGYGWISSGDQSLHIALRRVCGILNAKAGQVLSRMDIHDILNHIGTTLSSRRSAEISVMNVDDPEIDDFISAKDQYWALRNPDGTLFEGDPKNIPEGVENNDHRRQSNNSVLFYQKPSRWELSYIFDRILSFGGSEPGFLNGTTALARAPWFKGVNPCAEILLGNKSFCNLVEVDWGKIWDLPLEVQQRIIWLAGRANYRQTCVNLRDGILQDSWHELNEFLRLCGVGATGIVKYLDNFVGDKEALGAAVRSLREAAKDGTQSMARDLGLPLPKLSTTVKPSGTLGKIMDTTEGAHRPNGKYIFNNVTFSIHDPLVPILKAANYRVWDKPGEPESVLITLPTAYEDVKFTEVEINGRVIHINDESAIEQLERYKFLMENYVEHNCSITISYDQSEVSDMVDWLQENWNTYVGVSFIFRNDVTKTAADLGHPYLPQEVVTEDEYYDYVTKLTDVDLDAGNSFNELDVEDCVGGVCPVR